MLRLNKNLNQKSILLAIITANGIFAQFDRTCFIEGLTEETVDLRAWHLEDPRDIANELNHALGGNYKVTYFSEGKGYIEISVIT